MFRARLFSALGALSSLVAILPAARAGAQEGRVVRPYYGGFDVEYEPTKGDFGKFSLKDQIANKRWTILFFYPADFTFV